jgi:hypothetical protein
LGDFRATEVAEHERGFKTEGGSFYPPIMRVQIVIGQMDSRLSKHSGICTGFVIMPDHVHALLWFPEPGVLSSFMTTGKIRALV